jgi:FKBP-type peptidyl-prolyl cis-trans isomerase
MMNLIDRSAILLNLCALILLAPACKEQPKPASSTSNIRMMDDTLLNYNRGVVKTELQEIEDFILRYQWKMKTSPTGLRYLIYVTGSGPRPEKGKVVVLNYTIQLLNGDTVYQSAKSGPREFIVGKSSAESGLEEGVMMMPAGSRAKFIIPPHLAFGLLGDLHKIPERAVLVYDVELVEVKNPPRKR